MTASTSAGSLHRHNAEAVADRRSRGRDLVRSKSTCQVSFSEPGLLSRVRETTVAVDRIVARAARRRLRPQPRSSRARRAARGRARRAGAAPISSIQLLEHARGVLAARHAEVQPLLLLEDDRRGVFLAACSRTGRNPAAPSPPSCGAAAAGLRRASCGRRSAWRDRATASPSSASAMRPRRRAASSAGHQRGRFFRRQRRCRRRRARAGRRRSR